ncbi:MAG: hypothetical protein R3C68_06395 [Myxococcota bacterium]
MASIDIITYDVGGLIHTGDVSARITVEVVMAWSASVTAKASCRLGDRSDLIP